MVFHLPLQTIKQTLESYGHIHKKNPSFGMNPLEDDLSSKQVVILQNDGRKKKGLPIRFGFFALFLCINGHAKRYVNQFEFDILQHTIQLIPPGAIYSFENFGEKSEFYILLFNEALFESYDGCSQEIHTLLEFHKAHFETILLSEPSFADIKIMLNKIDTELKYEKKSYLELVRLYILEILYLMQRDKENASHNVIASETKAEQIVKQYLHLIEKHFMTKKHVNDYAKLLGISSKHLGETIKAQTHKNALGFIHERLYKEMVYLLIYTQLSIKQISLLLNFETPTACSRFFKIYAQMTPKEFRLSQSV